MTNETVAAESVVDTICKGFGAELSQGEELWQQTLQWLTNRGLSFAVSLIGALVILALGALVIRGIVGMVRKAVQKSGKGNTLFADFACNATSKVCWIVLLVVVLGKLGVNIAPIVAGLGVTGFILGFAFQESLGNLASGLMIAINEPFKVGDYVIVAGNEGTVLKVDMMATVLASADNKKIVIPNKSAWGGPIVNFSALGRRRVDLQVGVAYGADLAKAIRIALETLKTVPGVLAEPAPAVAVAQLGDSAVTLNVRPWTNGSTYWNVANDALVAVKAAFDKSGIEIPFPQIVVHQS